MRKTACIVSVKHISYNPRVVKEADALHAAGYHVVVVTICNHIDHALFDAELMASRSWTLKTFAYRKIGVVETMRWFYTGLRQKICQHLISLFGLLSGIVERAQGREFSELCRLACSVEAALYIAHHAEALGAAWFAARKHGAAFAFDAEDFHSGMFQDSEEGVPGGRSVAGEGLRAVVQRLLNDVEKLPKCNEVIRIEYLERKYLPTCDFVTAASDGIGKAYALKYKIPCPITILNVFPLEELSDPSQYTVNQVSPIKLYWYSQVIGPGRGLEDAIRALSLVLTPCELHLRGRPRPLFVEKLNALAGKLGVREKIHYHESCMPEQLIQNAARYDIGLALETGKEMNNLIAASNKMFTYMNAGLAIVASDTPGQLGILEQVDGVGDLCRMNDARSLAEAIEKLAIDPIRLRNAREASFRNAETKFNWEIEQSGFLETVEKVINSEQHLSGNENPLDE